MRDIRELRFEFLRVELNKMNLKYAMRASTAFARPSNKSKWVYANIASIAESYKWLGREMEKRKGHKTRRTIEWKNLDTLISYNNSARLLLLLAAKSDKKGRKVRKMHENIVHFNANWFFCCSPDSWLSFIINIYVWIFRYLLTFI